MSIDNKQDNTPQTTQPLIIKKRKLTLKQRAFIKRTMETKNPTQAVMEIYNAKSRKVASAIASQNLNKLAVKEQMEKIMEEQGLTDEGLISDTYHFVREAKKAKVKASDGLRALELIAKIKGLTGNNNHDNRKLTLNYNDLNKTELMAELDRLKVLKAKVIKG